MNLKEFKNEYRLVCGDTWGDAMEAWFESTGQMNKRGLNIPFEWNYSPGLGGDGTDSESYWFDLMEECTNEEIETIAYFMARYCEYLRFKEVDY